MHWKVVVVLLSALFASSASAQNFPTRPIKIIVPFAAGGPGDTVGRLLAQAMSKQHSVVVENISGAGGNIGATNVARAVPDGHTLLFHQLGMAISPSLYKKLEYDPLKDFEYLGLVAYQPNVIITGPSVAAKDLKELLAHLRANQDKMTFASTGPGGASHLCSILFMSATGINIRAVPYRATSPALTDILGGQVDLLCDSVATATPYIESGKVRAYGVTSTTRSPSIPSVPTLDEAGIPGFDMITWTALYAPKGTPKPVLEKLNEMLQLAVQDERFNTALQKVGSSAMPKERATPEAHSAFLQQEMKRWAPIIESAKIRGE
jgi:tripartite-type tricarboxylate transporter receptor subunit TctC